MSLTGTHPLTNHYLAPRRLGNVSLRGVTWAVLAILLFSLMICSIGVFEFNALSDQRSGTASPVHLDHASHDDSGTPGGDTCCAVLQNLLVTSHTSAIEVLLYNLIYVLLPLITFISVIVFVNTANRFFGTGPPGSKPNYALIANSLWPHAPPH